MIEQFIQTSSCPEFFAVIYLLTLPSLYLYTFCMGIYLFYTWSSQSQAIATWKKHQVVDSIVQPSTEPYAPALVACLWSWPSSFVSAKYVMKILVQDIQWKSEKCIATKTTSWLLPELSRVPMLIKVLFGKIFGVIIVKSCH